MKFDFKRKFYFSIFIFSFIFLLLISFTIFPLWEDIKEKSKELHSLLEKSAILKEQLQKLEALKELEKEVDLVFEKIENLFLKKEMPVEFIVFLEKISQDCQLNFEISKIFSENNEKEPWPSLGFQITLDGSFSNTYCFLRKLESGEYLIKIENLNMRKLKEKEISQEELKKIQPLETKFFLKVYGK